MDFFGITYAMRYLGYERVHDNSKLADLPLVASRVDFKPFRRELPCLAGLCDSGVMFTAHYGSPVLRATGNFTAEQVSDSLRSELSNALVGRVMFDARDKSHGDDSDDWYFDICDWRVHPVFVPISRNWTTPTPAASITMLCEFIPATEGEISQQFARRV
jgi:hypothetical protein